MLDVVTLDPAPPEARGRQLGRERADEIRRDARRSTSASSRRRPASRSTSTASAREALGAIGAWAPDLAREIEGIAEGAGLPVEHVAALNARTEVLALAARGRPRRVQRRRRAGRRAATGPVALQTWDWHEELASSFHVLRIEHRDGRVVRTLTEYGIVGKLGVSGRGLGLLLNILHHEGDGGGHRRAGARHRAPGARRGAARQPRPAAARVGPRRRRARR